MEGKTNKELLQAVLYQTEQNAKNQLTFAGQVSTFMNDQILFNAEIKGHLESNGKTNQKGLVEQVKENTNGIINMKSDRKIDKTKIAIIWGVVGTAAGAVAKLVF